ncbi:MAG: ATP-binding protein [Dehalococcoidia bacterium]
MRRADSSTEDEKALRGVQGVDGYPCPEGLEHICQRVAELATLLDISMALPATTDTDHLLEAIVAKSVEPFEAADAGVLFLYDAEEGALVPKASIGYRQEPLSRVRLKPGEAIAGKVYQRGEPRLCANPDQIAENMADVGGENQVYLEKARGNLAQAQSAICVPLVSKDAVLGAFTLANLRRDGAFSAGDLRLLQAIANQIAIVLENARLWVEVSRTEAQDEANRLKEAFLSGISHQLLTPITAIRAAVDILQTSGIDGSEPGATLLSNVARNTLRLQNLVQELLDLAQLRSGAVSLDLKTFDLGSLLEDCVASMQPLVQEKEQSLTLTSPSSSSRVRADRGRVERVAMNLLSNACKFTSAGGTIRVELGKENGKYVVSVADTGPGIAPGEQERVFERFYSRSQGPQQNAGTGLGLAIAKVLVELHGGRIWVESERGRGSIFSFTLPKEAVT